MSGRQIPSCVKGDIANSIGSENMRNQATVKLDEGAQLVQWEDSGIGRLLFRLERSQESLLPSQGERDPVARLETARTSPVYYMSPGNCGPKSDNFCVFNVLVAVPESTLSHPLSCLVNYRAINPASNLAGYSPRHPVRNPGSYLGGHRANNRSGYLPENPASSRENCLACNSAGHSADSPDNRRARNTESSPRSNGAGNP